MIKRIIGLIALSAVVSIAAAQDFESQFNRSLHDVLEGISTRFDVTLKYNIDTVGKTVSFADFRIRPYSVEESLTNVLSLFDYKWDKQKDKVYKLKPYEYYRRHDEDGEKLLPYLSSLYPTKDKWETRSSCLKKEVREKLEIDPLLAKRVATEPVYSKIRKKDGYRVQNFYLETVPGLYVCGSIYLPAKKGNYPLILTPNGHWGNGRYNEDLQIRKGSLARMGAVVVDYDLFGWGESEYQVGGSAHRTSIAQQIQILNGLSILDFMLKRKDIDPSRVGVSGGSGGGSQVVLLTALDDRFTVANPVVSLASHFDGGCPCESGMPISLACGGTCNPEILAMFAPKPVLVVSDGGDWTHTVPTLEYPYLQSIYNFYGAKNQISNAHIPNEGHSFGINKRNPVYDFFIKEFDLDRSKLDESKIEIEKPEAMQSFGDKGNLMPEKAIRSLKDLELIIDIKADRQASSNAQIEAKAKSWISEMNLNDPAKETRVVNVIIQHMKAVRDWHNAHPYTEVPAGMNPNTGRPLNQVEREVIANSAKPKSVHEKLMKGLRDNLTEDQVDFILDKYTVGKVAFTFKGYQAIVPDLKSDEIEFIMKELNEAREAAVDFKRMKGGISHMFEIHKTNCEYYFNTHGRDWRQMFKAFVDRRNAEKRIED